MKSDDWQGADAVYDMIRKTDDIAQIANNTGVPAFHVEYVKNHIFNAVHQLDSGVMRFDSDPLIANAWQRMSQGAHGASDIQLFKHELFEAKFERLFRQNYRRSHDAANRAGYPSGLE